MSSWTPINWDIPMVVKVPLVALLFCTVLGVVLGAFGLGIKYLADTFGPDAAGITVCSIIGFIVVCLFTWIALED